MFHAKNRENRCQESGVSRQANVGWGNVIHAAQAVNSVLQPVLGDVAVNERVCRDSGKAQNEYQAQRHTCKGRKQKEAEMLAQQFAHGGNIAESF